MQPHRIAGPSPLARSETPTELRAQRVVLLELLVDPPPGGDRLPDLERRLGLAPGEVERAVTALVEAGLARRRRDVVRPSPVARRFDALWPIGR